MSHTDFTMSSLPFYVNYYLCPPTVKATDFFTRIAKSGFCGVGLTQNVLQSQTDAELPRMLQRLGLGVSSLNSCGFFLQDGDRASIQDELNMWFLQQAAAFGQPKLNVIVGGSSTMPLKQARDKATLQLQRLSGAAADLGVKLMVEPLHHLNVRSKSCFNSLSQLAPIFDRIPGLTLNADLFHLWWDPDLERLLSGDFLPVGTLQICDVAMTPDHPVPRRVPLDEGIIPWRHYVQTLQQSCPGTPIELELFADQLPGRDLDELLAKSRAALLSMNGETNDSCPN